LCGVPGVAADVRDCQAGGDVAHVAMVNLIAAGGWFRS